MKLSYVFEMLASGELSNLHLVDESKLDIKPDKIPIVLRSINAALNDLHTRFLIARNIVDIPVIVGEDTYEIGNDDFIEILNVNIDDIPMIHHHNYTLLNVNKIKIREKLGILSTLRVEYKAKHRVLTEVDVAMDANVNLPDSHLNALLYFVASKLYTSAVNQMDGDLNEGAAYMRKFLEEVKLLENQGIDVEELEPMNNFYSRGFV